VAGDCQPVTGGVVATHPGDSQPNGAADPGDNASDTVTTANLIRVFRVIGAAMAPSMMKPRTKR